MVRPMRTLAWLLLTVAACHKIEPAPDKVQPQGAPAPMTLAQSGIVAGWMDKTVDPCKDFFQYACGGFTKTAEIPPDRSSWGTIPMVIKESEEFLKKVLEDAAANPGKDPVNQKIGAYYAACMDEAAIEKVGAAPIQPMLDQVKNVKDPATAAQAIAFLHSEGVYAFFALGPTQDFGDATKVVAGLDQSGLGLPERKYYLQNTDKIPKTRKVYQAHMVRMFQLAGLDEKAASTSADNAFRIETAIAKLSQDDVTRRDPHAIYHRVERVGLEKAAPSFPWGDYLAKQGIGTVTQITVNDPKYYTGIAKLITSEKPAALQAYLTWNVLRDTASDLSKAWVDEEFTMEKELSGLKELPPRWRRCVHHVDSEL